MRSLESPCKYLLVGQVVSRKNILRPSSSHVSHLPSSCIQPHHRSLSLSPFFSSPFSRIANCEPTWKICLREKRARRSSRPSLFNNFSATDKQHVTIYYNNTMRRAVAVVVVVVVVVVGAHCCARLSLNYKNYKTPSSLRGVQFSDHTVYSWTAS